jgi:outer membrane protein
MTGRILVVLAFALPSVGFSEEGRAPEAAFAAVAQPRERIAQAPAQRAEGLPTRLGSAPDVEAFVPLREAIELALRNNLDIALARIEPALASEGVEQAKGAFDAVGSMSFGFDRMQNPIASTFQPRGMIRDRDWNYTAGAGGVLPFGLRYSTGYKLDRQDTDSAVSDLAREFRGGWVTELTLPLIRDFRMNPASVRVVRGELGKQMSDFALSNRLSDLVASVENLYWDLAAARAEVNVAQKSLKTAQDLLEQTRAQVDAGEALPVAITEAESGLAQREFTAIQADNRAAAAKDALLNAILAPNAAAYEERDVIPEVPTFSEYPVDVRVAVERALANRSDLAEARKQVESSRVAQDLASNQSRARLDLTASYSLASLRGRSKPLRETFRGQLLAVDPNALSDPNAAALLRTPANTQAQGRGFATLEDFFRADGKPSYGVGAKFEIPFGNTAGNSLARQSAIELRRSQTLVRRMEQQVILEVRDAVRRLEGAAKAVKAAERRQQAAEQTLRAQQERLRLGDLTPFQTLQFEEDLADSERQLIDALRSHRNAITRIEQVQGTLLAARGVSLQD